MKTFPSPFTLICLLLAALPCVARAQGNPGKAAAPAADPAAAATAAPLASPPPVPQKKKPASDPFVKGPAPALAPQGPPIAGAVMQFDWIDAPRDAFAALLLEKGVAPDAGALRRELQTWIAQGKAKLAQSDLAVTKSGQRMIAESFRAIRYPAEPGLLVTRAEERNGKILTFEARSPGWMLEIEPVIGGPDNQLIDINCVAQDIVFEGDQGSMPSLPGAQPGDLLVPALRDRRLTASFSQRVDKWQLAWSGPAPAVPNVPPQTRALFVRTAAAPMPPPQRPRGSQNLTLEVEWVDVPLAALNEWLATQPLAEVPARLPGQVRSWLAEGQAQRREAVTTVNKSGQRAVGEAIQEYRFPRRFDDMAGGRFVPTEFDVQNHGAVVEFEPIIGPDGSTVDLNIAPALSYPVGTNIFRRMKQGEQWVPEVTSPIFYWMKTTTSLSFPINTPWLLGTQTPPGKDGAPDPAMKTVVLVTVHH